MSDSGNPTESLLNIGNFIILLVSGAIIPLLLVLYKSRCKRICWGCITRDVFTFVLHFCITSFVC